MAGICEPVKRWGLRAGDVGCGTVFKLTPDRVETVLDSFTGGADGDGPSDLIQRTAKEKGDLYGTAQSGGTYGAGTVFRLKK